MNAGQGVDVVTVYEQLERDGNHEQVGGLAYLNSLAQFVPSAGNIQRYAEIVRERSDLRQLMAVGDAITASALNLRGRTVGEVIGAAQRSIVAIGQNASHPHGSRNLEYVCAAELPDDPEPVTELIEGVIERVALSMLYGDSNSGKTFYAIGLGNAVAQGTLFMGRRTVKGLVFYLATEAPTSVIRRQQAYQRHFGVKVGGMVIVKSPINLYDGTADAAEVVNLIRVIEAREGVKAELVIGDTLSRLAAGANENAGEDMGTVIAHAEYIKREAQVHVLLIHHCGKDQARGARGWSGLRAAIDTEIEVTSDEATGNRVAETTKQRDLGGKGDRIGFRLEAVDLGPGQWDNTRQTSCVVVPADAPAKASKGKRLSEIAGAIVELLSARGTGMKKGDLTRHFGGRYPSSSVYRELKRLSEDGRIHEAAGFVALAASAK